VKLPFLFVIGGCFILIGGLSLGYRNILFDKGPGHDHSDRNDKGFAVVELFTSEGCSSCPPADNLMASIENEIGKKAIYILAYHVDYWDRLGWRDNFSQAAFTKRQKVYAELLHLNSVYTPQVVVNGRKEFIGSSKKALQDAIESSLLDSSAVTLDVKSTISNDKLNIEYETNGSAGKVNFVGNLIQKSAQTEVKSGENAGRKLTHVQIVRKQVIESARSHKGEISIALPPDYHDHQWELICFLQSGDGTILSASRSLLPNTER
jgi:hypothetical protein